MIKKLKKLYEDNPGLYWKINSYEDCLKARELSLQLYPKDWNIEKISKTSYANIKQSVTNELCYSVDEIGELGFSGVDFVLNRNFVEVKFTSIRKPA